MSAPRATIATAAVASLGLAGPGYAASQPTVAVTTPARTVTAAGTSTNWAGLADRVPTPGLHWTTCRKIAQCATAELPLNYHHPDGPKITVGLLKIKAKDPAHRIGTLFVNPGGPGQAAEPAALQLAEDPSQAGAILDRFDIVGIDPRGTGASTQLRCFSTTAAANRGLAPFLAAPFPVTAAQQRTWVSAGQAFGRACSTTGRPVSAAMSTTDDALDMDVLRRAVGDKKLTFLAQSFGSYLGELYVNMFPGRVRAVALDGIVNPVAYAGTPATRNEPVFDRIGVGAASDRALNELLKLCQQAGTSACSFASSNTQARFTALAARLKAHPLRLAAPGTKATAFSYANLIFDIGQWLRQDNGYQGLFPELTDVARLSAPGGAGAAGASVVQNLLSLHQGAPIGQAPDDLHQSQSGVACTDNPQAANAASWPAAAAAEDRSTPYFGAEYAWLSVMCATDTWTAQDPDVYRGPFNHRTDAPVLLIGNVWDPATAYGNALAVTRMLPNSRMISDNGFGHTAIGTGTCVDNTTFAYLINPQAAAPKVTDCTDPVQPFRSTPPSR
jgi:pimeloyl-ACP methyl ester carboxylesterase